MGKQNDPPPAPDPYRTAQAQTNSNVNTAIANSVMGNANQYSPYGSTTFTQNGNFTEISDGNGGTIRVPQWDQRTTLSPEQQGLYDQQVRNQQQLGNVAGEQIGRIGSILGTPVNSSGIPSLISSVNSPSLATSYDAGGNIQRSVDLNSNAPTTFGQTAGSIQYNVGPNDFSVDRDKVENALMARLQPQLDRDREALSARLATQGIAPGSQAYNEQMALADRAATDARMQAVLAGGQEQSRLFGMDLNKGQFNNQAQQQDYAQQQGRGQFAQAGIGLNNAALLSEGQFANAAQGQQNSQNAQAAAFGNAARQQGFANELQNAALNNQTSAQALQQMLALRNQPLNEISALMSGSQVSNPQVNAYQGGNVAGTDVMGAVYNSAALQNQQYQQEQQRNNAMLGGLFGLGGSLLTGGMMGGAGGFANSMFGRMFS